MKIRYLFLAVGVCALAAGCSKTSDNDETVSEDMLEILKTMETADVKEVLELIAKKESGISATSNDVAAEERLEYLLEICEGTNMVPYSVEEIDSTDTPLINTLFSDTVVIGDSRVEGVEWVLDSSKVFYDRGAYAGDLIETAKQAAAMYSKKALFWIGLNDMGVYGEDVDEFVSDYVSLIEDFLLINPGCEIYIHNQPGVTEEGIESFPYATYIELYNEAMEEMCEKNGWTLVDGSAYLKEENYADDGLHFDKAFYQLWIQDMANQLGLWEDLVS